MSTPPSSPHPDHEENIDYLPPQNDVDLQEIHESIIREKIEPQEGMEPLPVSLVAFFCVVIFISGLYLGTHCGGFKGDVFDSDLVTYGPVQGGPAKQVDPIAIGRRLFTNNCSSCHQASGMGVPGQYPPLAGSEIVLSQEGWGPNHIVQIVLNGLAGPVTVKGTTYNGNMPTHKELLKDEQIAYILTYVRQEWGNNAPPITAEGVAAMRAEVASRTQPWSEGELKAIPAKELPGAAAPAPAPGAAPAPAKPGAPAPGATAPAAPAAPAPKA